MKLTDILSGDCILAPLDARDKSHAIRQLVGVLARAGKCNDEQALLNAVMEREAIRSTGIGSGLAVPHAKSKCCSELVMSLGRPLTPIDFLSKDGRPVDLIVLLASPPDQTGPHIQALARISRLMLMDDFRQHLMRAPDASAIYETILRAET
jgi:fructose-specific phosphotransferase system IIA component